MREKDIKIGTTVKVKSKTAPGYCCTIGEPFYAKITGISTYGAKLNPSYYKEEEREKIIFLIVGNYYRFEDFSFPSKQLFLFEDEV